MSIQQMQQQIIQQLASVNDENMLKMLDEEIAFYLQHKEDPIAMLTEKDAEELAMLANQPLEGNTMSFNEFKSVMDKWRMKS